jgi:hypothetical protein
MPELREPEPLEAAVEAGDGHQRGTEVRRILCGTADDVRRARRPLRM